MQLATDDDGDALPLPNHTVLPGIRRVLDYIDRNYAEQITMTDLSVLCRLSLHRFVTVFRIQVGMPPHKYLCHVRVRQARALLRQGLPLATVAIDTGFYDQSHLTRHFKRHCGVTPGRFSGIRPAAVAA